MAIKIINHKKVEIENSEIPCKCGCGNLILKFDKRHRERFYKLGHGIKININSWNKGKKNVYSEETLEKMRNAKLGIKLSKEHAKKIGDANRKNTDQENYKRKKARWTTKDNIKLKPNCEICNSTNDLQRHHWRYDKPLMVNTLCKECHTIQHVKNFNKSKYAGGILR